MRHLFKFNSRDTAVISAVLVSFMAYGLAFIWKSSFIVDGTRYFCLFDDAMISMRYAWHFAAGHGLVWNPGEHVEGFTNPGWTLLMALVHFVDSRLPVTSLYMQLLSLLSLAGAVLVTWLLSLRLRPHARESALVAAITVATYFPLNFFSLMGMETGLVAFLVTLAMLLLVISGQSGRPAYAAWVLFGVATIVRLDALVPLLAATAATVLAFPQLRWKNVIAAAISILVFIGSQTLLRGWYYDSWLPNTYYLKMSGVPVGDRISRGLYVTSRFAFNHLWPMYLLLAVWAVIYVRNRQEVLTAIARFPRSPWFIPLAVITGQLAYSAYVGGDVWEHEFYANRFLVIAIPALYLLMVHSVVETLRRSPIVATSYSRKPMLWALPLAAIFVVQSNWHSGYASARNQALLLTPPYLTGEARQFASFAHRLSSTVPTTASIALDRAGTLPYFTPQHQYYDILGKTDPYISRLPSREVADSTSPSGNGFVPGHTKWSAIHTLGQHKPSLVILSLSALGPDYDTPLAQHYRSIQVPDFSFSTYVRAENYADLAPVLLSINN